MTAMGLMQTMAEANDTRYVNLLRVAGKEWNAATMRQVQHHGHEKSNERLVISLHTTSAGLMRSHHAQSKSHEVISPFFLNFRKHYCITSSTPHAGTWRKCVCRDPSLLKSVSVERFA
jgi:hypothetical protein